MTLSEVTHRSPVVEDCAKALGLASHTPCRGVSLTADGRRVALEVIHHHRLLELFLSEVLEMP